MSRRLHVLRWPDRCSWCGALTTRGARATVATTCSRRCAWHLWADPRTRDTCPRQVRPPSASRAASEARAKRTSAEGRTCRWCTATDAQARWSSRHDACAACDRQRSRARTCAYCGGPYYTTARGRWAGCRACGVDGDELTAYERLQRRRPAAHPHHPR